jgi:GNAT acetyltransferase-like protein
VLVAEEQGHVSAIAPLMRRRGKLGRLQILGVDELHEPAAFLFAEPAALGPLTESLARSGVPLLLHRCPADSPLVSALRKSYRWRGVVITRPAPGYPRIPLDEDEGWRHPEQRLSSRRRADLKRARRLAETMGPLRCEILTPTVDDLGPLLEEALEVEAAGWKGRDGSAVSCDAKRGHFYRHYAAAAARKGFLRLCFLRIGGRAAAMQLAVEWGSRFWLLKIGYHEAFARCSPGTLLIRETVRYAAERGLRSYEFLGTVEPWTQMWTQLERPCVSVMAYPAGLRGLAALAADVATVARGKVARVF